MAHIKGQHTTGEVATPRALTRRDWGIAAALFAATLGLLLATMDMGFTRDEGFYFNAAYKYIGWFEELWHNAGQGRLGQSFTKQGIDRHWSFNPEHPVLMKTAFALSHKLFFETLGWMSESTAMRLPGAVMGSVLVAALYLFGTQLFGSLAGVVAAGAMLAQPRFFFHAHLACFDVPITTLWFMVVWSYWQSLASRRWAVVTGILWGLALSTKLNAFFLPIVLGGHWLVTNARGFSIRQGARPLRWPAIPKAFWAMVAFGPLLFVGLWPRHWHDTATRIMWYMKFHMHHEHYFVYYFGENLQQPPFPVSFPWAMTAVTVPATILLAFLVGLVVFARQRRLLARGRELWGDLRAGRWYHDKSDDPRGTGWLLAINLLFPLALISLPNTPIFGGTKHWMPAMPFLALLAGLGAREAARLIGEGLGQWRATVSGPAAGMMAGALMAVSVVLPAAFATGRNHPHGTSYYNELIGSYRGAADAGMMRQFWGYASRHGLPWVNTHADVGARIWHHDTIHWAWDMYGREGLRRPDLRASSMERSDVAMYEQEKGFVYQLIPLWQHFGTYTPSHVVEVDGVPLLSIYERPNPQGFKHP